MWCGGLIRISHCLQFLVYDIILSQNDSEVSGQILKSLGIPDDISTWFGSISFDTRRVVIFSTFPETFEMEDDIEDVVTTHLYVAILMKGRLALRKIDGFERKPTYLSFELATPSESNLLVSTAKDIYIVRQLQKTSEVLKVLTDSEDVTEKNPTKVDFPWPVKIVQAAGGHDFLIFRDSVGNVFSMGTGTRGELGVGLIRHCNEPVHIEQLAGIRISKVVCGGWHTVVLTDDGDAYTWGWNRYGQLGKEKAATEMYPVLIDPAEEFDGVSEENIDDVAATEYTTTIIISQNQFSIGSDNVDINEFALN